MDPHYNGPVFLLLQNNFNCGTSSLWPVAVRNVGHASDISISTISLFGSEYFRGNDMTQYSTNVPNHSGAFSSFIVTPPGEATFYTAPNYGGLSICLKPSDDSAAHYTFALSELGVVPGQIKSMRFGCHSNNIFYSSTSTVAVKQ